jgi:hypothetical protein
MPQRFGAGGLEISLQAGALFGTQVLAVVVASPAGE